MRKIVPSIMALWLVCLPLHAASRAETRAFDAAASAFQAGIWDRAAQEFGAFAAKYPKSEQAPEAILYQAEAKFKLGRANDAVTLLSSHLGDSGLLTDQYLYWMGEANFAGSNYNAAADVFGRLLHDFPVSNRRLEAALGEAAARAKLEQWPRVVELLSAPDSIFQINARSMPTNELVFRGYLLLGEVQLAQKNYKASETALDMLTNAAPSIKLDWQRQYLQCRLQVAERRDEDALVGTTQLLALADTPRLRSESIAFQGGLLEHLKRFGEAIAAYQKNLADDVPTDRRREAAFKIAELSLAQGQVTNAIQTLETYLTQHTNSAVADAILFTLGELNLKAYAAVVKTNLPPESGTNAVVATNFLQNALARFQAVVTAHPNSPLVGKALLDKGWCLWLQNNVVDSEYAFQGAALRLPLSEDQAVARYKWADTQYQLTNYFGAVTNYNFVVQHYPLKGQPGEELIQPALYQIVRASLALGDLKSASEALRKILDWYPNGFAADRSLLLIGQEKTVRKDTAGARELFAEFAQRYPQSPFLPEVGLAMARTYEEDTNWNAAIQQYGDWLENFTNNPALPRAEYYQAWANFQAGNETNALTEYTNFVGQFFTNALAPSAQWWIADYYFRQGDFVNAEKNYQLVFQNWPASDLAYQARMMAGRAAVARQSYSDAIGYFTNLTSDLNCPADLKPQAIFAYGDALMREDSPDVTNKFANIEEAIRVFSKINQLNSTNAQSALAWGKIGNCYLQLAAQDPHQYDAATNAYEQVIESPWAGVAARSEAKVGLATVAEKMAQGKNPAENEALLQEAFNDYLDVFYGKILRDGEKPDAFWVKKAGLEAGRLAETLKEWQQAIGLYRQLQDLLPPLRSSLEKKILKAQENLDHASG